MKRLLLNKHENRYTDQVFVQSYSFMSNKNVMIFYSKEKLMSLNLDFYGIQ